MAVTTEEVTIGSILGVRSRPSPDPGVVFEYPHYIGLELELSDASALIWSCWSGTAQLCWNLAALFARLRAPVSQILAVRGGFAHEHPKQVALFVQGAQVVCYSTALRAGNRSQVRTV